MNMNQKPKNISSLLPPDDEPCQMSPFSDERWEIDQLENIKRRKTHRNLILDNLRKVKDPPPIENPVSQREEPKAPLELAPVQKDTQEKSEPVPEFKAELKEKEVFKFEPPPIPKPKSLADIPFESPRPANLFPLLKFPYKRPNLEELNVLTNNILSPVTEKQEGNVKTPHFAEFKDIKFDRAVHYGVTVPFWQFKGTDLLKKLNIACIDTVKSYTTQNIRNQQKIILNHQG